MFDRSFFTGRCRPKQVGRGTTYGHKNKRQGGTDRSGNKETRLEQDVQRELWTKRLSRRLEEHKKKKRKKEKEMEAKCEGTGGGKWECVWRINERWTIYEMKKKRGE